MAPYKKCTECGVEFKHSNNLYRHRNTVHGGRKFACTYCAKSYKRQDDLSKHVSRKHKEITNNIKRSLEDQYVEDFLDTLEMGIITNPCDGLPAVQIRHQSWLAHTPPPGQKRGMEDTDKVLFATRCVIQYWTKHGGQRTSRS